MHCTDSRQTLILDWLNRTLSLSVSALDVASSDASFRRYFRIQTPEGSRIVMDAPPPNENVEPFIRIAQKLRTLGLAVPRIDAADPDQGLLLLEDFGSTPYLSVLSDSTVDTLYEAALGTLHRLVQAAPAEHPDLPLYDAARLHLELELFNTWCLETHLGLTLKPAEQRLIEETFKTLVQSALEQPQVVVHRDFHSRNLMKRDVSEPGVLDFQDAVRGPLTYDVVSLLRDCYVAWPPERVDRWLLGFHDRLQQERTFDMAPEALLRGFDLMGLQRHLKATGIFTRLLHRDQKPGYLKDIPRTLHYGIQVGQRQPELAPFARFLEDRVLPAFSTPRPT